MPTTSTQSSKSRETGAAKDSSKARLEVLNMLKEDHRMVDESFTQFEKLQGKKDIDEDSCNQLVRETCLALQMHAQLEEDTFYPTIRAVPQEDDLVDEAEVEHQTVKALVEQLLNMQMGDDKFEATFTVLGEYVRHHVKEEEGQMFRKLTHTDIDWQALLEEMQERRTQLIEELGIDSLRADESDSAAGSSRKRAQ